MSKNVALVAGAVGIVGKYIILELSAKPESDWEIFAISRRSIEYKSRAKHVAMDLLSPEELAKKLEATPDLKRVTHIFFAAYQEKPTQKELSVVNLAMLKNLVDAVEKVAPNLKHVSLIEGTKWYGVHLGAAKTPCLEDDPRYMTPNFYYDQEDYLINKVSAGAKWSWSAMRPNPVCGVAFGNPMNLATGLAVYATFCREQGLPFRFPGSAACWNILFEVVDAGLLARALIWAATTPQCANQAFNCSNGDVIRWSNIWEKIGKFFGLEVPNGPIMQVPLSDLMADNESAWAEIAKKHKLREIPYKDLALWPFVEWVMTRDYDWFCDVNKARRFGFHEMTMDSGDMFIRLFKEMQQEGIIPKY